MAERDVKINFLGNTTQLNSALRGLKSNLKAIAGPVFALGTAAGLVMAIKRVGEYNDRIRQMGRANNASAKDMLILKASMQQAGLQTGISEQKLLDMSEAALRTSKSAKFVSDNTQAMAEFMAVTGASGTAVGDSFAEVGDQLNMSGKELKDFFAGIYSFTQQKGVEVDPKEFLPSVDGMVRAFGDLYKNLPDKLRKQKVAEAIQMAAFVGPGGASIVTRLQTKMFRAAGTKKGADILRNLGLTGRSGVSELMEALVKKFGTDTIAMNQKLIELTGAKGGVGITHLLDNMEEYNKARKATDTAQMDRDAAEASKDFSRQLGTLNNAFGLLLDKTLGGATGPLAGITDWVREMTKDPGKLDMIVNWVKALGIAFAVWKVAQGLGGLMGMVNKTAKGGLGTMGATPVYVVNMGAGGMGGMPGMAGGAGGVVSAAAIEAIAAVALPILGMVGAAWFLEHMRATGQNYKLGLADRGNYAAAAHDENMKRQQRETGLNNQAEQVFSSTVIIKMPDGTTIHRDKKDFKTVPRGEIGWGYHEPAVAPVVY